MPLYKFKCEQCGSKNEHFAYPGRELIKSCPKCGSADYKKTFTTYKSTIEYSSSSEHFEKVIMPGVNETYERIGREALDEDANTLENIFGEAGVKDTIAEKDD